MKTKTSSARQRGFTLIEVLMAMAIFTIGILGLFGMQSAAIKENLSANTITTGSSWAMDQVEQLINLNYSDPLLLDTDGNGCAGLGDWPDDDSTIEVVSGDVEPIYRIYWNVANDCTLTDIPIEPGADEDRIYRPKHLRIIVTRDFGGAERDVAIFNYIKQNIIEQ